MDCIFIFINLRSGGDPKQIWYISNFCHVLTFLTDKNEIPEVLHTFFIVILSSDDDDDDDDNDRTNRRESTSPQPADSACSSPAPSTGKVEAALNENTCRIEHELRSIPADSELNTVILPRKARMKDQVLFIFIQIFPLICKYLGGKDNLVVSIGKNELFIK